MISKELDEIEVTNSWEKNGRKAEEQIAFYLKRRFHSDENFYIINGLRFRALDGTYTQIDHLVVSQYAAFIIESKSVTSVVKYDATGQWLRLWDNHYTGMPSPVQQAKNQECALREIMQANREQLRRKVLFGLAQGGFMGLPIHTIVAISDAGRVIPPAGNDIHAGVVMKADLVTDRIVELYGDYKKADTLFGKSDPSWSMPMEDVQKTVAFLLQIHEQQPAKKQSAGKAPITHGPDAARQPTAARSQASAPTPTTMSATSVPAASDRPPQSSGSSSATENDGAIDSLSCCPECRGKVSILWGAKYKNYYWHCQACGKNFSINYKCPGCGEKLRIRKQGNEYFIYCDPCNLSALYFTDGL
ncbi:NERD domain-containing protein [Oligosphaera ethanolica]|uniref:Transcription elongation factor Elf1 n=1 Tax=Oligosphaera ethanolica TaxID=760260 RepID=A0AAE3VEL3_9BACT|nr:NERD domain-containing protein [Oligosphaera ethanolica]MDQ0288900.1 transcription elongation factor Elf1 [Oligosphaera ethanolica]